MSLQHARVPDGMSYVNALYALYRHAIEQENLSQDMTLTSEKVAYLFKNYPSDRFPRFYMQKIGGQKIEVLFYKFPSLVVSSYNQLYGKYAAQLALASYDKVPSEKRFDPNDSHKFTNLPLVERKNSLNLEDVHIPSKGRCFL